MPGEVPLRKKLLPTVGRGLWYICGVVLLLSLPTFSYLVPSFQGPVFDGKDSPTSGFVPREGSLETGKSSFSAGEGFVRSRSGGFYSRSSYLGTVRPQGEDRPQRTRGPKAGTKSERGLNRLSRRSEDRISNRVESPKVATEPTGTGEAAPGSESVASELTQIEQAYQSTLNYLFPAQPQPFGSGYGNPFNSALNGLGGGGTFNDPSGEDPADDSSSGEGEGEGSGDSGGGNEGEGSSGSSDSDDDPNEGEDEPRVFGSLLIGEFAGRDDQETLFRASPEGNGAYILEDGSKVSLFNSSGVVGIPQTAVVLAEDEMLLSTDFNGDGSKDIVIGAWNYPISSIRGFSGQRQLDSPVFEGVLQFVKIQALAVYDFESDGTNELAVLFSGNPNLVIYKIADNQLKYSREMSIPFQPAVLVNTQDQGVFKQRYLQVLGYSLQRSVVFSSLFPGTYSFSRPSSFRSLRSVVLDPIDDSSPSEKYSVLKYDDVVSVVEIREDEVVFIASFRYDQGYPKLAIGRSDDDGSRQVIFVP